MTLRTILRTLIGPALAVLALPAWNAQGADDLTRPIRGELPTGAPVRFLGTNSCSANACHNRGNYAGAAAISYYEPRTYWEHIYWRRYDPHVRAFAVLTNEQSRRIEKNLRNLATADLARPEQDGLCLSCHVHQNFSNAAHGPEFSLTDGVGCESCHGASEHWSAAHVSAGWRSLAPEQKAAYGFVPLDGLADRARSCTPCHVGSTYADPVHGLVDVNHDLIAAGHPRLNFEFASYHSQYPKHWIDVDERAVDPAYEARLWVVGQLATAESALSLLEARAGRAVDEASPSPELPRAIRPASDLSPHAGPWPEFAEYDCYACHHDVQGGLGSPVGVPGSLPWGSWYYASTGAIAETFTPGSDRLDATLDALRLELRMPYPDPLQIRDRAAVARGEVAALLASAERAPLDPPTTERLFAQVIDDLKQRAEATVSTVALEPGDTARVEGPTWDENAQAYLAAAALSAALVDLAPGVIGPDVTAALEAMVADLSFPSDSNTPPAYRSVTVTDGLRLIELQLGR